MARVFLIRHGQASWGKKNYDILSPIGVQQSNLLGHHLAKHQFEAPLIICGEHKRQRDTAKHSLRAMHFEPKFEVNAAWNEFDFQDVISRYKPIYQVHSLMVADLVLSRSPRENFSVMFEAAIDRWRCGKVDDDYKESWPAFEQRTIDAVHALKSISNDHKNILIYTSSGVISNIISHLLDLKFDQWRQFSRRVINSSVTQLDVSSNHIELISFNEHSHLCGRHAHLLTMH